MIIPDWARTNTNALPLELQRILGLGRRTDRVPAMLTPGEGVLNAPAMAMPGMRPAVDAANAAGMRRGYQAGTSNVDPYSTLPVAAGRDIYSLRPIAERLAPTRAGLPLHIDTYRMRAADPFYDYEKNALYRPPIPDRPPGSSAAVPLPSGPRIVGGPTFPTQPQQPAGDNKTNMTTDRSIFSGGSPWGNTATRAYAEGTSYVEDIDYDWGEPVDPLELLGRPLSSYVPGLGAPGSKTRRMEGPNETSSGAKVYTYEDWKSGKAPYVTGALTGPGSKATGQLVYRKIGKEAVPIGLTDRGPGAPDPKTGIITPKLDIAFSDPKKATSFFAQGQTETFGGTTAAAPSRPVELALAPAGSPGRSALLTETAPGFGIHSAGGGMMSSMADYDKALAGKSTTQKVAGGIGKGIGGIGKGLQQSAQEGFAQAMKMASRDNPFARRILESLMTGGGGLPIYGG